MAKYRVYLKDGLGVFNVEADTIEIEDCYYTLSDHYEHSALFDKASVLAIINTDKAERVFASGGVVSIGNIEPPYIVNLTAKEKEGDASC